MADLEAAARAPRPRYLLARGWLVQRLPAEPEPQVWLARVQRLDALAKEMEREPSPVERLALLSQVLVGWIELIAQARQALPGPPSPPPLFPRSRPRSQGKSALATLQRAFGGPTLLAGLISDEFERLVDVEAAAELVLEATRGSRAREDGREFETVRRRDQVGERLTAALGGLVRS